MTCAGEFALLVAARLEVALPVAMRAVAVRAIPVGAISVGAIPMLAILPRFEFTRTVPLRPITLRPITLRPVPLRSVGMGTVTGGAVGALRPFPAWLVVPAWLKFAARLELATGLGIAARAVAERFTALARAIEARPLLTVAATEAVLGALSAALAMWTWSTAAGPAVRSAVGGGTR